MLQAVRHSLAVRTAVRHAGGAPMAGRFARTRLPSLSLSCPLHRTPVRSAFTYPSSRSLDEIVKLPLLIPHTRDEVVAIWQQHHALAQNQAAMSAHLNAEEHETFLAHASKAPLFVVPSFRMRDMPMDDTTTPYTFEADAFEMMLVNVQQSSLLLTSLEEYKLKGAGAATPYAVITFYPDLAVSKDLVLVRGEMLDVNVTIPQLRQIWHLLHHFFIASPEAFAAFPEPFNRKPKPTFEFEKYVAECQRMVADMKLEQPKAADQTDVREGEFVAEAETQPIDKKNDQA